MLLPDWQKANRKRAQKPAAQTKLEELLKLLPESKRKQALKLVAELKQQSFHDGMDEVQFGHGW